MVGPAYGMLDERRPTDATNPLSLADAFDEAQEVSRCPTAPQGDRVVRSPRPLPEARAGCVKMPPFG